MLRSKAALVIASILFASATAAQTPPSGTPPRPAPAPKAPATAAQPSAPKAPATPAAARRPATPARPPAAPALVTDDQKAIYALGLLIQQSIVEFDFSPAELEIIKRALTDGALKRPAVEIEEWRPKIGPLARARGERVMTRAKTEGVAYAAKAAAEPNASKTTSGLVYREITPGTGPSPTSSDLVRVHYRGTLIDGTEFDSSYKRNEPAQFSLGGVIGCWTEGVPMMKVGGKARLVCPSSLAYGDEGSAPIPGGATLIFEIELLQIVTPE